MGMTRGMDCARTVSVETVARALGYTENELASAAGALRQFFWQQK